MALTPATSVVADGVSLTSVLAAAYKNSNELKVARANLRRVDEGVAAARSAKGASVTGNASASVSRNFGAGSTSSNQSVSITGSQQLYDGGQDDKAIEAARMNVLAQRESLRATEQNVLLSAVAAFFNVRRDQRSVAQQKNNVSVLRQQVRAAQDRFDVGEVTLTDVSQTRARLASAISQLALAEGNLRNSLQNFRATTGTKVTKLHAPKSTPRLPKSARAAEAVAIKKHPRILQSQFSTKAAQLTLDQVNLNRKATVSATITGRAFKNNSLNGDGSSIEAGINATVPIFQGGALDSARRSALASLHAAEAQLQLNGVITRQNVNSAYVQWQTARSAKKAVQSQIKASQIAFEGVREEAKLGARTTLDVLDAEQELLSAQSSLISANRDEFVAAYSVLSEMGLLTVDYLKLPVKKYDPDVNYIKANTKAKFDTRKFKLLDKLQNR